MAMASMGCVTLWVKMGWQQVNVTSNCATKKDVCILLEYHALWWGGWGLVSSWRECPLQEHDMQWHVATGLLPDRIFGTAQDECMRLYDLTMMLSAVAGCFAFKIIVILTGCTCDIPHREAPVLNTEIVDVRTYCRRPYCIICWKFSDSPIKKWTQESHKERCNSDFCCRFS